MKRTIFSVLALAVSASAFAAPADLGGEDYYLQFVYKKEVSDDGDGDVRIQYRFLGGQSEVVVNDLKKIMVSGELYLLDGMQFVVAYSEMLATRDTPTSPWRYMPNPNQGICPIVVKGTWSAPADKLVLSPAVSGDRATFDSRNSVKLVFDDKLLSPEVKGSELVMDYGYSNAPIEMTVGRGGFCPY